MRSSDLLLAPGIRCASHVAVAASAEDPFLALNQTAMSRIMAGMTVRPTGDADRDFVAIMVPHHQGAIDMAQAELVYGRKQKLFRPVMFAFVGRSNVAMQTMMTNMTNIWSSCGEHLITSALRPRWRSRADPRAMAE